MSAKIELLIDAHRVLHSCYISCRSNATQIWPNLSTGMEVDLTNSPCPCCHHVRFISGHDLGQSILVFFRWTSLGSELVNTLKNGFADNADILKPLPAWRFSSRLSSLNRKTKWNQFQYTWLPHLHHRWDTRGCLAFSMVSLIKTPCPCRAQFRVGIIAI